MRTKKAWNFRRRPVQCLITWICYLETGRFFKKVIKFLISFRKTPFLFYFFHTKSNIFKLALPIKLQIFKFSQIKIQLAFFFSKENPTFSAHEGRRKFLGSTLLLQPSPLTSWRLAPRQESRGASTLLSTQKCKKTIWFSYLIAW